MPAHVRLLFVASLLVTAAAAATPPELTRALEFLHNQKSFSWEVINADPGPQAQQLKTRRGSIMVTQQNTSPHIRGSIDRNGDTRIEREWSDGLKLDTIIMADGRTLTNTPDGWMTPQDILAALGQARVKLSENSPRVIWLRRADRPEINRPDAELAPLLKTAGEFTVQGESYVAQARVYPNQPPNTKPEDAGPGVDVALTINLSKGLIRDYEVKVETTRAVTRARVQIPISDQRIVIVTYLPIRKVEIPEEAQAKLATMKGG
jgi:hypothetical protein